MLTHAASSREAATLTALYAVLFAGTGVSLPFLPVWLDGRGLGPQALGPLLALPILVRILATAPLAGLVDRGVPGRRLLALMGLAQAATFALMLAAGRSAEGWDSWPLLALAIAANAVAQAPLVPVTDYLTLRLARRAPRHAFARIRLGGSISFLAANLAAGWWLARRAGADGVIGLLAVLALVGAVVALALPREHAAARPSTVSGAPARSPAPMSPMRARALWLAILAAAAGQASHAGVYAFGSLHWRALGAGSDAIGLYWATGVLAEIAVLALAAMRPAWRENAPGLLALGALAGCLRWPGLALAGDAPGPILALQALHGLTFGATLLGSMAAVSQLAPEGLRGRAQGRLGAAVALGSATATLAGGLLYRVGGGDLTLAAMLPLSLAQLALAGMLRRTLREGVPDAPSS